METERQIRLTFTEPPSNKEYRIWLRPRDGGWVVDFAYGRIGNTLQSGTKTSKPLDFGRALVVFQNLLNEKTAKGYKPDATPGQSTSYQAPVEDVDTGLRPQLLTPISKAERDEYIQSDAWWMQQKSDGNRVFVVARTAGKHDVTVFGANRKGQKIALPSSVVRWAQSKLSNGWKAFVLDGELIGETYYAFDMLEMNDLDYRDEPYSTRSKLLNGLIPSDDATVKRSPTAKTEEDKRDMLKRLLLESAEGVVFKQHAAPYTPGRLPTQVKCKFWESASFIVKAQNEGVRSIELGLLKNGDPNGAVVGWGSCTIPTNYPLPPVNAICEITYLYAVESIYQPQYKGERTDIDRAACVVSQLKFKPNAVTRKSSAR